MSRRSPEQPNPEFDKFKELTKNLIAVPKSEVDKKREGYENKKKRESKKKG